MIPTRAPRATLLLLAAAVLSAGTLGAQTSSFAQSKQPAPPSVAATSSVVATPECKALAGRWEHDHDRTAVCDLAYCKEQQGSFFAAWDLQLVCEEHIESLLEQAKANGELTSSHARDLSAVRARQGELLKYLPCVAVRGPLPGGATVRVDGKAVRLYNDELYPVFGGGEHSVQIEYNGTSKRWSGEVTQPPRPVEDEPRRTTYSCTLIDPSTLPDLAAPRGAASQRRADDGPGAQAPPPPLPSPASRTTPTQILGLATGGVAAVLLSTSVGLGLNAWSAAEGAMPECEIRSTCKEPEASRLSQAKDYSTATNVTLGVGVGALALGAFLYLRGWNKATASAPSKPQRAVSTTLAPIVTPTSGGLTATCAF